MVYIITGYTDMRKSIDGLAAIIQGKLQLDPYSKALFCGRSSNKMKGLLWDGDGFCFCISVSTTVSIVFLEQKRKLVNFPTSNYDGFLKILKSNRRKL